MLAVTDHHQTCFRSRSLASIAVCMPYTSSKWRPTQLLTAVPNQPSISASRDCSLACFSASRSDACCSIICAPSMEAGRWWYPASLACSSTSRCCTSVTWLCLASSAACVIWQLSGQRPAQMHQQVRGMIRRMPARYADTLLDFHIDRTQLKPLNCCSMLLPR